LANAATGGEVVTVGFCVGLAAVSIAGDEDEKNNSGDFEAVEA
jgi:hypothetical protein